MITINAPFAQTTQLLGVVGRTGENEARRIVFDCSSVLAEYPEAKITCAIQRACDRAAYLKEVTMSGGEASLLLTDADVAAPGKMRLELRAVKDGQTLKSAVYTAEIVSGLRGGGNTPGSPEQDMLDRLQTAADAANAAAESVQEKLGKLDAPYTLIEAFTLDEGVATVVRTAEPDGTAYDFDAVYIKLFSPEYTENRRLYFSIGNTDDAYIWAADRVAYFSASGIINTDGYSTDVFVEKSHGLFHGTYYQPAASASSIPPYSNHTEI